MANDIKIGDIQFYDDYLPALTAGNYRIDVKQTVTELGIPADDHNKLSAVQEFIVHAPQFALDPLEIHGMIPPSNSTGKFADELPHLVLNKRVIPWERKMRDKDMPWMALLVLQEDELIVPADPVRTDPQTKAVKSTVGEYQKLSKSKDILVPTLTKEDDISDEQVCYYIQLSPDVFQTVMPHADELRYLTHVRQVNTGDKAIMGIKDDGWFGVVTANRFPQSQAGDTSGVKNIVHLISLEKMEPYLTGQPDFSISGTTENYQKIGLLSLARWTFRCLPDNKEDFRGLMEHMVFAEYDEQTKKYLPDNLWLRQPPVTPQAGSADATGEVQQRLQNGYVPLPYHTRSGEDTFAWYRGPLTPVLPATLTKTEPFQTADSAMIYDKSRGVFDNSLAAAWQIGRLLSMSEQSFGQKLLDFRRRTHRLADRLLENLKQFGFDSDANLEKLASQHLMHDTFINMLQSDLLGNIAHPPEDKGTKPAAKPKPQNPQAALQEFLARSDVQATIQQVTSEDLELITQRLAKWQLLYDVPFDYLVPNPAMLPMESIRFFYLDQNWLDAMLDGSLSIAMHSTRDTALHKLTKGLVRDGVKTATQVLRDKLRGLDSASSSDHDTHRCGFLIRSAVVAGWPGLAVRGYEDEARTNMVKLLRMDHLSKNVLLCIFWGIPKWIDISEPQEGFQFGMSQDGDIDLRSIVTNQSQHPLGTELGAPYVIRDKHLRAGRILDVRPGAADGLVQSIATQLTSRLGLKGALALRPSDFALQMVKSPQRLIFKVPNS